MPSFPRQPAIGFVLACVFMDALGIGLIIPVLPRLIGELATTRDLQTMWYGLIMLSFGLMQFGFSPILGALSDRIGRRPVLLTGIFGLGLMMLIPAITHSLWAILASRIVGGMLSANVVVAQAYIADVTVARHRVTAFGKIGAIFGIAFVLGPAIGGILGQSDPRVPFLVASAVCLLNFLYGFFVLPESLTKRNKNPFSLRRVNPFAALIKLGAEKRILPMLIVLTIYSLAQGLVQCTWALYCEFRYSWGPLEIGLSIFALGASISATQGLILPRVVHFFSQRHLTLIGLSVGALSLIGVGLSIFGLLSAVLICTFALMGVVGPTLQGAVSRLSAETSQGVCMGAISSLNSFTGAISPIIGTPLLMYTARHSDHAFFSGTPYFLSAILLLGAFVVAYFSLQNVDS